MLPFEAVTLKYHIRIIRYKEGIILLGMGKIIHSFFFWLNKTNVYENQDFNNK